MKKNIAFSPPDITQKEIEEVNTVLHSGWITTGPKTVQFEKELSNYINSSRIKCLNSATAGLFLSLKLFGVGEGDEVITTPYTYAATANVIMHIGARPVFVDISADDFNIDSQRIGEKITPKTKAVISVDYGGWAVDYDVIRSVLDVKRSLFSHSSNLLQEELKRPIFISDAAHSFGGLYNGRKIGNNADITTFSFHAVKNLTTAEGGAVVLNDIGSFSADMLHKEFSLLSLHGQSKSAFEKINKNNYRYDVLNFGYKSNLSDVHAAIGLSQLRRYESEILSARDDIFNLYMNGLGSSDKIILPNFDNDKRKSSRHIFPIRLRDFDEARRDEFIASIAEFGISTNVHFVPLPMFTAYRNAGYDIKNYPKSFNAYKNEVSLPIYSTLSKENAEFVVETVLKILKKI